jgi:hypothetical protein
VAFYPVDRPPAASGRLCRLQWVLSYRALAHLEFLRQTRLEQAVVYLRDVLGNDDLELLNRAGVELSYDEAVDLALQVSADGRA